MILLTVVLLAQFISPPDPPPWPPRYTVRQGASVVVQLDKISCAGPISGLGMTWRCDKKHAITIRVPDDQQIGTEWLHDQDGREIANLEIVPPTLPSRRRPHPPQPLPANLELAGVFISSPSPGISRGFLSGLYQ